MQAGHAFARGQHTARCLVTQNDGFAHPDRSDAAVEQVVHVGSADATGSADAPAEEIARTAGAGGGRGATRAHGQLAGARAAVAIIGRVAVVTGLAGLDNTIATIAT